MFQAYKELEEQAVLGCQKLLCKLVKMKYKLDYLPLISKEWLNQKRYCIVSLHLKEEKKVSFLVIFRTQKFHSFGKIYENNSDEGETINLEDYDKTKNKIDSIVYYYAYMNEIKYISIRELQQLRDNGKVYIHSNKADGKEEIIFNIKYTKNIGEWLL